MVNPKFTARAITQSVDLREFVSMAFVGLVALVATVGVAVSVLSSTVSAKIERDIIQLPYTDVSGNMFKNHIAYLYEQGILENLDDCDNATAGKQFCPKDKLARWEVAVWLVRAVHGKDVQLPDVTQASNQTFSDVDYNEWYAPYIEKLKQDGTTLGVTRDDPNTPENEAVFKPLLPAGVVTRAQMASFLTRSFTAIQASTTDQFNDVASGNVHREEINGLYEAGVTKGCVADDPATKNVNERKYCPSDSYRDQMAALLARAISLRDHNDPETGIPTDDQVQTPRDAVAGSKPADADEIPQGAIGDGGLLDISLAVGAVALVTSGKMWVDARRRNQLSLQ